MSVSDTTALVGLLIGLVTFLGGGVAWYRGAVEKQYAAQRDFGHLRRNQEQINAGVQEVTQEVEALNRDIALLTDKVRELDRGIDELRTQQLEMKGLIHATFNRLEGLSYSLTGGNSSGWRMPPSSPPC